ncbi:MAG: 3-dehydroquinate synthase [Candidatus Puniceispirillales bacterium]
MTATPIQVAVDLGDRQYPILIGAGLLAAADRLVADHAEGRHVIIISDEAIRETHGKTLAESLGRIASRLDHLSLPGGEGSKSLASYARLMDAILALGVDRNCVLVALGGGVIGDLVGFAAASLLRGVDFIQVPTTLLAQVDSSVGGKTGINASVGKNLIGAFYQPQAVLADTDTLKTLPPREIRAGYAEVVKYGLLGDAAFFAWLEDHGTGVLAGDDQHLGETIAHCCRAKAAIVAADERESGKRALLNLGHTFGHAYEAEGGYDGTILHGEAIAAGMVDAFRLAVRLGHADAADRDRVIAHLGTVGLPLSRHQLSNRLGEAEAARLLMHMKKDKKASAGHIVLIVPHGIGDARIDRSVNEADVMAVLEGEA